MTSSLVGSEMCIRDRPLATWVCGLKGRAEQRLGWPWHAAWRLGLAFLPVSYTHLTLPTICSV
eukprot:4400388-Prorocentrum_lima.AAC.1